MIHGTRSRIAPLPCPRGPSGVALVPLSSLRRACVRACCFLVRLSRACMAHGWPSHGPIMSRLDVSSLAGFCMFSRGNVA
jgi:hypothetical protein